MRSNPIVLLFWVFFSGSRLLSDESKVAMRFYLSSFLLSYLPNSFLFRETIVLSKALRDFRRRAVSVIVPLGIISNFHDGSSSRFLCATRTGRPGTLHAYDGFGGVISNAYDHMSRRVLKVTPTATHTYLYDDWNLVQETISTASDTTTNHYVWGKDLSGTLQGAGGVGGLLAVSLNGAWYFPFYDNNGNVLAYADEQGAIVAEYTYDAFGRTIAATGSMADAFRHRFSTKYYDAETRLYYYGYRFYVPELMRWLNRDPIEEGDGWNLYEVVRNNLVSDNDVLGLWKKGETVDGGKRRVYIRENADTFEKLAELLKLDINEIHKWAKIHNDSSSPNGKIPCEVSVPNEIVVFTSKPSWYDSPLSVVANFRSKAEKLSEHYEANGYKVVFRKHNDNVSVFKALWKSPDIYGFVYAGHGAYPLGLRINGSADGAVFPCEVSPPYKLAIGLFYACYSDNEGTGEFDTLGSWKDHVAIEAGAEYLGYHGLAWWWSAPIKSEGNDGNH
ncbi:MAG: RHS repeat domain-containing protein [Kiritimatiellia bacterium]